MVSKEALKKYANKLMFDMKDEEYETLQKEFDVILKQMDIIAEFKGIKDVEPMTFPYELTDACLREDVIGDMITVEEALSNAKEVVGNEIKVPKVVE